MSKVDTHALLERADALCKARGVRLTPQRRTVLRLVSDAGQPLSAYELLDLLRAELPNAAPPTVYRALDFLIEQKLIHKLESLHAYVGCDHPEHAHASQFLICSDCGDVSEVEDSDVQASLQAATKAQGFVSNRPIIEVIGTCADCTEKQK